VKLIILKRRKKLKIERESLENRLIKEIRIIKDSGSKIQLEIKKMKLEKQKLKLKNEALIEKNDNLRGNIKEEIDKNKLLVEKNNNLKKMIKEDINKK